MSDDVDSGGVFGTIPSSLTAAPGTVITVYTSQGGTELYQYTVGTDSLGTNEAPTVISGSGIDSGIEPFLTHPVYIDYANDTIAIDK